MKRPTVPQIQQAGSTIGEQLTAWRKLQNLTAAQVAVRANISRGTLHRIESGSLGVSLESFLSVARALGILNTLVDATDPYETDLGRARADLVLPKRVRQ
jgi:transcriptional regulator with XRE-family HTH domain